MADTGYNPPASKRRRIAATEYQEVPDRGLVWGEVHDENAWSLGGVAGHAGIFSTLDDMAILSQTMQIGRASCREGVGGGEDEVKVAKKRTRGVAVGREDD